MFIPAALTASSRFRTIVDGLADALALLYAEGSRFSASQDESVVERLRSIERSVRQNSPVARNMSALEFSEV